MGIVYHARHLSLNREVALKMILGSQQSKEPSLRRFRIEVEAVAHLDHPNIVPIYEVGEIHGQPYFTMKFVDGGSLSEHLEEIRLSCPEAGPHPGRTDVDRKCKRLASLTAAVARAVHHAHQRGILHRDLKPANILLGGEGQPLVADFGLAKRVESPADLTQSMTIVGTANYMAPEQARGNKKQPTTTADVYSLGAILYELLTGRPPFLGDSYMGTLMMVVRETPISPRQRNPYIPPDLEMICLKALAKAPEQRYATALDLARDLERWCTGEIISLRSPTLAKRAWHWTRRNRLAAALLGTIAGLMVVVSVGSTLSAWHIAAARDRADNNAKETAVARDDAEEKARQARASRDIAENALKEWQRVLVSSYVANGTRAWMGGMFSALYSGTARRSTLTRATPSAKVRIASAWQAFCVVLPNWYRCGLTTIQRCLRQSARTVAAWSCCRKAPRASGRWLAVRRCRLPSGMPAKSNERLLARMATGWSRRLATVRRASGMRPPVRR